MTDDKLSPEVRDALRTVVNCPGVPSLHAGIIHDELYRYAAENAELRKLRDGVRISIPTATMEAEFANHARPFKERAEKAEAELARWRERWDAAPITRVRRGHDRDVIVWTQVDESLDGNVVRILVDEPPKEGQ